jgi:hypothetical protein
MQRTLAYRTVEEIDGASILLRLKKQAEAIDPTLKVARDKDLDEHNVKLKCEGLIIATEAASVRSPIGGMDLLEAFCLRWMRNAFSVQGYTEAHSP